MTQKILAILSILSLLLCASACGSGEENNTTVTGLVVSVDGTVISLMKTDGQMQGDFSGQRPAGEMPERPTGEMPEDFDPEKFQGKFPEGMELPEDGEIPERPTGEMPERPTGEASERPEGERPDFQSFGNNENVETESLDLKNAHISVEIDEGKASGSMEDIEAGSFVTLTLNEKGEVTNVLVSASSGMGQGFGGRGQGRPNGETSQNGQTSDDGQNDG